MSEVQRILDAAAVDIDAIERRLKDDAGLDVESAVLTLCVKAAPDDPTHERYTLTLHSIGNGGAPLPAGARLALIRTLRDTADDLERGLEERGLEA